MLHLYRIYQLEEVIHENLRPEKSQEIQKLGGKRKSYNLDPDDEEALGGDKPATKKQRRKKVKKGVIESTELAVVEMEQDANAGGDKGIPLSQARKEEDQPSPKLDGGTEEQEPEVAPARKNRGKKKEPIVSLEASEAEAVKVSRKGKKSNNADIQASEGTEPSQVKKGRKRRKMDS